jgi:uncharacterized protein YdaU (DUF1376 family)
MLQSSAAPIPLRVVAQSPVPPGCSMKGYPYMPLYGGELLESPLWARAMQHDRTLVTHAIALWWAAWQQVPAGSLEDNDDVLATAARCSPERWPEVRSYLLHGWLRCSADGRLYNPRLCESATSNWEKRTEKQVQLGNARAAKAAKAKRAAAGQADLPLEPAARPTRQPMPEPAAAVPAAPDPMPAPATVSHAPSHQGLPAAVQDVNGLGDCELLHQPDQVESARPIGASSGATGGDAADPPNSLRNSVENPPNMLELDGNQPDEVSVSELTQAFNLESVSRKKGESPLKPPRQKRRTGSYLDSGWQPDQAGCGYALSRGLDLGATVEAFHQRYRGRWGHIRSCDWGLTWKEFCDLQAAEEAVRVRRGGKKSRAEERAEELAEREAFEMAVGLPSYAERLAWVLSGEPDAELQAEQAERARQRAEDDARAARRRADEAARIARLEAEADARFLPKEAAA